MTKLKFIFLLVCGLLISNNASSQDSSVIIDTPEKLYGNLFFDVQNSGIYEFRDSKTFCDAIPKKSIIEIKAEYDSIQQNIDTTILKKFIENNFYLPEYKSNFSDNSDILKHISALWNYLTNYPDSIKSGTLIPLPNKYLIPGGRFREVYYWDSYFSMIGLKSENRTALIKDIIDNFSFLISKYGHIPNGNRTYYLSRSQPPFFSLMIDLYATSVNKDSIYVAYLPYLLKEYVYWMDGIGNLNNACKELKHVVQVDDSTVLNRYWDDLDIPRSEAYKEDVNIAVEAMYRFNSKEQEVYRDLRAAAESGWDFSSRWLEDQVNLNSIQTTHIIPVDLNCLLYKLEKTIALSYIILNNDSSKIYLAKAEKRRNAIDRYFWNIKYGFYMDYNFASKRQTQVFSLAALFPLFFKISDKDKAWQIAGRIHSEFLKNGGLQTTTILTNQLWDMPNGWAPLQWIAIVGLKNYNFDNLAEIIKECWVSNVNKVYKSSGKLLEKYDVIDTNKPGGGGEYPNQDGFGWTNGVYEGLNK
jgi:alpha,alpha-trehalase